MKQITIAFDIDGIIIDLISAISPILSQECKHHISEDDIYCHDIGKALGISEKMPAIWDDIYRRNVLIEAPPVKGAIDGLNRLHVYKIVFITSRPECTKAQTEQWFEMHQISHENLIFVKNRDKNIEEQFIDILVEDDLEQVNKNSENELLTILLDRPWNRCEILPNGVKRAYDWDEIVEVVLSYRSKIANKDNHNAKAKHRFAEELWELIEKKDINGLIDWYTKAFWGKDPKKLSTAIKALIEVDVDLVQPISKLLDRDVEAALYAFSEIGIPDESKLIVKYLKSDNSRVREAAVNAIGKIGDNLIIDQLIPILDDTNPYVREAAVVALGKIGSPGAIFALANAMKINNYNVKLSAIKALGEIAIWCFKDSPPFHKRRNPNLTLPNRDIFEKAMEPLNDIMRHELPGFQIAAINTLGDIGLSQSINPLLEILENNNEEVQKAAIAAIGKVCQAREFERYFEAIENTDKPIDEAFFEAYKEIDIQRVSDSLRMFLNHSNPKIRMAAVDALREVGAKSSVGPLTEALSDHDKEVRNAAQKALETIQNSVIPFSRRCIDAS